MMIETSKTRLNIELWPKQAEAFESPATEILFGGATRGGKSHFLRCALIVWCLRIPQLQCTLIRKKSKDILENHVHGKNGFIDLLYPLVEAGRCRVTQLGVTFDNGARIIFKHCQDMRQSDTAQGIPSNVLIIDEATQIPERLLNTFRAWCTMPEEMKAALPDDLKGKFPRIYYMANPIGPSLPYFRRHFVKSRPAGAIELINGFKRQFIPAFVTDNPSEDAEATKGRVGGMYDAATAKALIEGDWDAPLGDFYPEWDEERHVVPDFTPPSHWFRYRAFDWGSADPFAAYWIAVSDGDMFETEYWKYEQGYRKHSGRLWFPRGAKIFYREWYGCREDDPAKGIGLRNTDIAKGIIARSPAPQERNLITLTDSFVFPDRGEDEGQTIAKTFADQGVPLTLGNTSRVTGWAAVRDALIGIRFDLNSEHRDPMIFICQSCKYLRDYFPALPRHPNEAKRHEDAAESGEATHSLDACRLAIMATPRVKDKPTPDALLVQAHVKAASIYQPTFQDAVKLIQKQKSRHSGRQF